MNFDQWWKKYRGVNLLDQLGGRKDVARDAWQAAWEVTIDRTVSILTKMADTTTMDGGSALTNAVDLLKSIRNES